MAFCCLTRCARLIGFCFFDLLIPASWAVCCDLGLKSTDSAGALIDLIDLSTLMEGEASRRAARECTEASAQSYYSVSVYGRENAKTQEY